MDKQTHEWAVTFTFAGALAEGPADAIEDEFPPDLDASVSAAPPDRVMVTLHLLAGDAPAAVATAEKHMRMHFPLDGPQVAVEAVVEAEHERRAQAPTLPELVGASEVATMLGVTRQRVHQLREHPSFPTPLVEVAMGPLWDARAVEAFARAWSRRPGRPPLAAAQ
jgi:hypothetical protein